VTRPESTSPLVRRGLQRGFRAAADEASLTAVEAVGLPGASAEKVRVGMGATDLVRISCLRYTTVWNSVFSRMCRAQSLG